MISNANMNPYMGGGSSPFGQSGFSIGGGSKLDNFQTGLDVAGIADPTGIIDGFNALIYLGRGDWTNAGISALGIIPYIGDAGKAGRLGSKAFKLVTKGGAGVYDLGTTLGKYVGQSKDIMGRVTSHFAKGGKLSAGELSNSVFHSMSGSTKLQREVYEHYLISEKYGIDNLINARLPMGGRLDLYNSMIDDVIKQFGLPR